MNKNLHPVPTMRAARADGFTLIELLVTVGIMALLAALIVGVAGFATRKAAYGRAQADIEKLRSAMEEFRVDKGRYPTSSEFKSRSLTNYVAELQFADPWGREYEYTAPQTADSWQYAIKSKGYNETDAKDDIDTTQGNY